MKRFKKLTTTAVSLLALLTIAGCGNAKSGDKKADGNSTALKKAAPKKGDAVSIKSGMFIKPSYTKTLTGGKKYVALKLHIKNQGAKQELSESNFAIKDKDGNRTKAESVSSGSGNFETMDFEHLGHGESLSGYVVFPVKENQKYTLVVSPQASDYETKIPASQVSFNTKGYQDQEKEAQTAMTSYVQSVFLNQKEGEFNYDKFIGPKLEDEKVEFRKEARSVLEDTVFSDTLKDDASVKMIEQIQAFNAKNGSVKYQVESATPTTATVEVTPTLVKLNDLDEDIYDIQTELEDAGKIDPDASYSENQRQVKETVAQNFPEVLKEMPVREASGQTIKLVKDGKKWTMSRGSYDSEYESLAKAFGGYLY